MLLSILIESESSNLDVWSFFISLGTFGVAIAALFVWRAERRHDLKIETLAKSQPAMGLIKYLRNPLSFSGEIDQQLLEDWKKNNINIEATSEVVAALTFHSKLVRMNETYKEIQELKAKLWAHYNDEHAFLKFYAYVLQTVSEVSNAHRALVPLANTRSFSAQVFDKQRADYRKVIYEITGDEISVKLDNLYNEVLKHRHKKWWFTIFT